MSSGAPPHLPLPPSTVVPLRAALLTIHRDPVNSPGDFRLGPALNLAVQADGLSWPVQMALGLVQPVGSSYKEGRGAEPKAPFLPGLGSRCAREGGQPQEAPYPLR